MVTYASRQLRPYELNYPTHDLELVAFVLIDPGATHSFIASSFSISIDTFNDRVRICCL